MAPRKRTIPREPPESESSALPQPSGRSLFAQPDYDLPPLPRNIGEITTDQLMDLFVQYTEWQNFANVELAQAEVDEEKTEAALELFKAKGMALQWDLDEVKDKKVTIARARMLASQEYQALHSDYLIAYARRKVLTAVNSGCERSAFVVSRELSRRIGAAGGERRNSRWAP